MVTVNAALLAAVLLTALVPAAFVALGMALRDARREAERLRGELAEAQRQNANLGKVAENPLYRNAIEDERARALQAFLLMSVVAKDVSDALDTLAPHLRGKAK